jgi:hypothetical protein
MLADTVLVTKMEAKMEARQLLKSTRSYQMRKPRLLCRSA